jgi:hypothetical protein
MEQAVQTRIARKIRIPGGQTLLEGTFCVPTDATASLCLLHGSGSSRHSPRNQDMAIMPGASHLFEEPGALEEVSRLAVDWSLTASEARH